MTRKRIKELEKRIRDIKEQNEILNYVLVHFFAAELVVEVSKSVSLFKKYSI